MDPLQPLFDLFGRRHDYLRISLTDRCNFRCTYCMPKEGMEWKEKSELLTLEEIETLADLFVRLGVKKIRLTGGEPSLRNGYIDLIRCLSTKAEIHLTTNGSTLVEHATRLKVAGLKSLNISIDSLRPDRFAEITHRDSFDLVSAGIEAALTANLKVKLNVVVMRGVNDDEVVDFVRFAEQRSLEVRFIEFMPFLSNDWRTDIVVPYREILGSIQQHFSLQALPGEITDVAKRFSIGASAGTVGFVTSVTDSFCGGCNRLRLTSEGLFKTCLFLPPKLSLRDMLRNQAEEPVIVNAIRDELNSKWAAHPPMDRWQQRDTLTMVQIGG